MKYVNLVTVETVQQAYFIESALDRNGIPCIVANENITSMFPYVVRMGDGIQIRVAEPDVEEALAILAEIERTNS